jgi:2-dehydropantoate 2-reductase
VRPCKSRDVVAAAILVGVAGDAARPVAADHYNSLIEADTRVCAHAVRTVPCASSAVCQLLGSMPMFSLVAAYAASCTANKGMSKVVVLSIRTLHKSSRHCGSQSPLYRATTRQSALATAQRAITMQASDTTNDTKNDSDTDMQLPGSFEPIHILGAGSIGLLLAASMRLAFPSYPLQLLLRHHHESKIDSRGHVTVCINQIHGSKRRTAPRIVHVPAGIVSPDSDTVQKPFKHLLVTTKSYQAVPAIESVVSRIDKSTKVLILCNGALAVRDEVSDYLSEKRMDCELHMGVVTHGAYRQGDNDGSSSSGCPNEALREKEDVDDMFYVTWAGVGTLHATALASWQLWDRAGLNVTITSAEEMERMLWYKLAANCVINPLAAIHGLSNGEVANLPEYDKMEGRILEEIVSVQRAAHPALDLERDQLSAYCRGIMVSASKNKCSMLQDVLAKRETEIKYLNGYVVGLGSKHGIDCSANEELASKIEGLYTL